MGLGLGESLRAWLLEQVCLAWCRICTGFRYHFNRFLINRNLRHLLQSLPLFLLSFPLPLIGPIHTLLLLLLRYNLRINLSIIAAIFLSRVPCFTFLRFYLFLVWEFECIWDYWVFRLLLCKRYGVGLSVF